MQESRILLVDDSTEHCKPFEDALAALQVQITMVKGGREALAAAIESDFAMALVNVNMRCGGGMDAYEIASILRQDPRASGLPVLYFSSGPEEIPVVKMAYRMGAAAVMLDVCAEPELLRHQVRTFLDLHRGRSQRQGRIEGLEQELKVARDELTRQKREVEVVRRQATSDLLTGLPNRLLFEDRISGALIRARRSQSRLGLAYLDLDGFKPVNDEHGHAAGDEVLATIARRLVTVVRASDTVSRIGGDEFAVVLENFDSTACADYVGQKILKAFDEPIPVPRKDGSGVVEVKVGVSIGMALYPEHADNRNDLLMLADMAMYSVKRDGGGLRVTTARPSGQNVVSAEAFRQRQEH